MAFAKAMFMPRKLFKTNTILYTASSEGNGELLESQQKLTY